MVMDRHTALVLIGNGLIFGVIHVLTGPDHMSAVAALTAGDHYSKAFAAGIRWGMGHSTGLFVVAVIFLSCKGEIDLDKVGRVCDWVVGVLMIALGIYTMIKAFHTAAREEKEVNRLLPLSSAPPPSPSSSSSSSSSGRGTGPDNSSAAITTNTTAQGQADYKTSGRPKDVESAAPPPPPPPPPPPLSVQQPPHSTASPATSPSSIPLLLLEGGGGAEGGKSTSTTTTVLMISTPPSQQALILVSPPATATKWCGCGTVVLTEEAKQRLIAFGVGIVHGSGAPGGVLGVLPAVQMKSWSKACLYMAAFSITSVLAMGGFAAAYGALTHRIGKSAGPSKVRRVNLYLRVFSSCLSIIVGVLWLTLTAMGILDQVLP